jgi:hypothetical protein
MHRFHRSAVGGDFHPTNPTNPTTCREIPMDPEVFPATGWSGYCSEPDQAAENPTNSPSSSSGLVITGRIYQ